MNIQTDNNVLGREPKRHRLRTNVVLATALLLWCGGILSVQQKNLTFNVITATDESGAFVNSTIVSGPTDAILVDPQFKKTEAQRVVDEIKKSGKHLNAVYVTHAHPDHMLGLEVIHKAFPDAKVLAAPAAAGAIKVVYGPFVARFGKNMGIQETVPVETVQSSYLELEGHRIEILANERGDSDGNSSLWIPSQKTLIAGDVVYNQVHLWMAETVTADERKAWLDTVNKLEKLNATKVIPGHMKPGSPLDKSCFAFTRAYLNAYGPEVAKAAGSEELISAMQRLYRKAVENNMLTFGAKINKGEAKLQ